MEWIKGRPEEEGYYWVAWEDDGEYLVDGVFVGAIKEIYWDNPHVAFDDDSIRFYQPKVKPEPPAYVDPIEELRRRVAALEAENRALKVRLSPNPTSGLAANSSSTCFAVNIKGLLPGEYP